MSKQESYAVLTEQENLFGPRATSTGTTHTLTVLVDLSAAPKTVSVSDPSLHIHNGDRVVWDFKDKTGGKLSLADPSKLAVVFIDKLESAPEAASSDPKIGLDASENTPDSGTGDPYTANYQIKLGTDILRRPIRTPGDTQLVIDGLGKPPGTAPRSPHDPYRRPVV
ncbi:MAG: hypothetical protein WAM82_20165 [Thermoanaerobaculia bacterium]